MKILVLPLLLTFAACATDQDAGPEPAKDGGQKMSENTNSTMELGAFSVSLAVKDLAASRAFYEKLGFTQLGGVPEQNWLILQNGTTTIGLFQGMFEKNVLTFNPGWTSKAQPLGRFTDVRDLQARIIASGIEPQTNADANSTGPAHFILVDPDGNSVFFDQHVPKPDGK